MSVEELSDQETALMDSMTEEEAEKKYSLTTENWEEAHQDGLMKYTLSIENFLKIILKKISHYPTVLLQKIMLNLKNVVIAKISAKELSVQARQLIMSLAAFETYIPCLSEDTTDSSTHLYKILSETLNPNPILREKMLPPPAVFASPFDQPP